MFNRLFMVWDHLRTSLWFVPALLALMAVGLAVFALRIDAGLDIRDEDLWGWVYAGGPDDAAAMLTTLLNSMITMTSLVFSVTMVVLTLAANHFGTRLIRSFMSDRRTQVVLGLFIMTIVYLVLVLRRLEHVGDGGTPHLSVTLATALSLGSVFVLIFFIHNVARSIDADTVVGRVARELEDAIDRLAPSGEAPEIVGPAEAEEALPSGFAHDAAVLPLRRDGYVQAIDYGALVDAAADADAVVRLDFRPGQYVYRGALRIVVHPQDAAGEHLADLIDRALTIGSQRTPAQDLEFSIRHLEEIAVRALSPGINDPYPAIAAIERLGSAMARLMGRALHPRVHRDARERVRVVAETTGYGHLVDAAFHQIRQNGADKPAIALRLLATLRQLSFCVRNEEQRSALLRHADLVLDSGRRAILGGADKDELERAHAEARAALQPNRRGDGDACAGAVIRAHGRGVA